MNQKPQDSEPMGFFDQLRKRKVFKVTSVYAIAAWGGVLGAVEILPSFGFTDGYIQWMVIIAIGLLPVVALLAWLYELTPRGIKRDEREFYKQAPQLTATIIAAKTSEIAVSWRGELHRFKSDFVIGRDPACELHLDDPQISRRHAEVFFGSGRWQIKDLGSRNGLKLEGKIEDTMDLGEETTVELYEGGPPVTFRIVPTH